MPDYKVIYRLVDGATREVTFMDRVEDIPSMASALVKTPFINHIDGNKAVLINIKNVAEIVIQEVIKEEAENE